MRQEFNGHKQYFFYALVLSTYVFLPQIAAVETPRQILLFFLSIFILWLISKVSKFLFLIAAFFTLLVSFIDIHLLHHWGDARLGPRLQVALLSPVNETLEYLQTYFDWVDVGATVYFLMGIFLLFHMFRSQRNQLKYLKAIALLGLLAIFLFLGTVIHPFERIVPFSLFEAFEKANAWRSLVDKRMEFVARHKSITKKVKVPYDKIVIIIGESANRNHMSAYGYRRKTTPFLERLSKMKYGYLFGNVISPANATRFSIPLELTNATVGHFFDFLTSESLVTVLNDLGFKTFWLSNQSKAGKHETYVTSIAMEADHLSIVNAFYTDQNSEHSRPDEILLEELAGCEPVKSAKEAYFFHLMGSHALYSRRYTDTVKLISCPENRIDQYDNSIFYTDYVLSRIFDRFKGEKVLFLYISDHAEFVGREKCGHGTLKSNRDEVEIPLVVYSSIYNDRIQTLYDMNISVMNMEWFNDLVQYFIGVKDELPKDLNDTKIMTVTPSDIVDYRTLEYRKK